MAGRGPAPGIFEAVFREVPSRLGFRPRFFAVCGTLIVVVILLLSIVSPTQAADFSGSPGPSTPSSVSSPPGTTGSPLLSDHSSSKVDAPALCLLGVQPECSSPSPTTTGGAITPLTSDPISSWTNITPPEGAPNPSERDLPAMVYYPEGSDVILFGGYGFNTTGGGVAYYNDTWKFTNDTWSSLISNSSCTAKSCPSGRAGAMIAWDSPAKSLVLFGGYSTRTLPDCFSNCIITTAYNDTWLYSGKGWKNITTTAGPAPSPRFSGAMTWDSSDNYDLLFGGSNAAGISLGDTWRFQGGMWTNMSGNFSYPSGWALSHAPEPRAGASIASSPNGYVMLYGGEDTIYTDLTYIIQNSCEQGSNSDGSSIIAWWFHDNTWTPIGGWSYTYFEGSCTINSPSPGAPVYNSSCGRIDGALGWSPKNNRFVLYGGYGYPAQQFDGYCNGNPGTVETLNDTRTYGDLPGQGFLWYNATNYSTDPSARSYMGYASVPDGYFNIFGGSWALSAPFLNQTWRFYEVVHAQLSGPLVINSAGTGPWSPFAVVGYGGSGNLSYNLTYKPLRTVNHLASAKGTTGCGNFTLYTSTPTPRRLPYNGSASFTCQPSTGSYNIFRATLVVFDRKNSTDTASANWTFTVLPPESMAIYSEYIQYFYTNFSFDNTFGIYAEVAGQPAVRLNASLAGAPLAVAQDPQHPDWWYVTNLSMGSYRPGAILFAGASFGKSPSETNWTQNATYDVDMITVPSWLLEILQVSQATQKITTSGSGPFNKTFSISESYSWNLASTLGFNISVPLAGGNYSLVPTIKIQIEVTSEGDLTLAGTFSVAAPGITIGPCSLKFTASLTLSGTFDIVGTGVQWVSASVTVTITASISASVPIYGFSILGVSVGISLSISVSVKLALTMILAPFTGTGDELIPGFAVIIASIIGSFTLSLSIAVVIGLGFASVAIGGTLSLALEVGIAPTLYLADGWVNGTLFVKASFLCWSDTWNLVSGTVFSWKNPAPMGGALHDDASLPGVVYHTEPVNNGTDTTWSPFVPYFVNANYDSNVWNPLNSSGTAIEDLYPSAEVTGASGYNGAYVFYSNYNPSQSVLEGLTVAGAELNGSSNALTTIPAPADPGFDISDPQATTLPNGDIYVLWDALPWSEANAVNSPLNLTSVGLQGAEFYPANGSWGPVHTYTTAGFAESYQVDATGGSGVVVDLISETPLVGPTSPEVLNEYSLSTGAQLSSLTEFGLAQVVSVRGAENLAVVRSVDGNYSAINIATGGSIALNYIPPGGDVLISAAFAQDSPSTLVLLYRGGNSSVLVVYDTATGLANGGLVLGGDVADAQAIANGDTYYVFVRTSAGIDGWTESGSIWTNLTTVSENDVQSYGLVQAAGSIVVYGLVTNGNNTAPIDTLTLTEVSAALATVPNPTSSAQSSATSSGTNYLLYLAIVGAAVAVLLAVVAVISRRRRPPSPAPVQPWAPPQGAMGAPEPTAPSTPSSPDGTGSG
jgi:hypothetical protein